MVRPAILTNDSSLNPVRLQQRIYENLRSGLIAGLYAPGQTLSLRRIASASGVSPMPVREAVKRLISEGAVELLPNRTIAVPRLSRRDFIELTSVRTMLEGYAAELATGRVDKKQILQLARKKPSTYSGRFRPKYPARDADESGVSLRFVSRIRAKAAELYRQDYLPPRSELMLP